MHLDRLFLAAWMQADSVEQLAEALGMDVRQVESTAERYRERGYSLPHRPVWVPKGWSRLAIRN